MEIITANELMSGATVYYYADGSWDVDIDQAKLFDADAAEARDDILAKAMQTGRLVSLETEQVTVDGGRVIARRLRERIRAEGPTTPRMSPQDLEEGDHVSL